MPAARRCRWCSNNTMEWLLAPPPLSASVVSWVVMRVLRSPKRCPSFIASVLWPKGFFFVLSLTCEAKGRCYNIVQGTHNLLEMIWTGNKWKGTWSIVQFVDQFIGWLCRRRGVTPVSSVIGFEIFDQIACCKCWICSDMAFTFARNWPKSRTLKAGVLKLCLNPSGRNWE